MKWVIFPAMDECVSKRIRLEQYLPMVNEVVLGAASLSTMTTPITFNLMTRQLEYIKGELTKLSSAISKIELTSEKKKLDRTVNDVQTTTVLYNERIVGMKAKHVEKLILSDLGRIENAAMLIMLRQVRQLPGSEK